jgi:hypothetical protein
VLVGRLPDREHEHDGLSEQTSTGDSQDLARCGVEPLGVVDQADQGLRGGDLGQQAQHGQAEQKPIRDFPHCETEGQTQGLLLRLRERLVLPQHRRAQLMQGRERQLQLGLDTGDLSDLAARCLAGAVLQQGSLSDPRFSTEDQHRALALVDGLERAVDLVALA